MASSSKSDPPELPGFYFDPDKGRYFRVLPGVNNHNPLTQKHIKLKTARTERVKDSNPPRPRCAKENVVALVRKRSLGFENSESSIKLNTNMINAKLKSCGSDQPKHFDSRYYNVQSILPNCDYSEIILCGWQDGCHAPDFVYSSIDVTERAKYSGEIPNGFCFFNCGHRGALVTITTVPTLMYWITDPGREKSGILSLKNWTPFACATALNPDTKYVASCSNGKNVILISNLASFVKSASSHPRGGPGCAVLRMERDVLAQSFSYAPNIHFNGMRGGTVVGIDVQSVRRRSICCGMDPHWRCNVEQIRVLKDQFSVLVGYRNPGEIPKMLLWDARFPSRPVLEYQTECYKNRCETEDVPIKFTMTIDKEERILTSVLPDLRARFWSIKTGEIVKKYPENDEDPKRITAAAYTTEWEMYNGDSGILAFVLGQGYEFSSFASHC